MLPRHSDQPALLRGWQWGWLVASASFHGIFPSMLIRSFQQQPRMFLMTQVHPGTRAISVPRRDAALSQTGLRKLREQFLRREPQLPDLGNGENATQSPNLLCWYENQTGAVLVKGGSES